MLPTLSFCHAFRRRGCMLLAAMLLSVVAANGQALTPEALRDIRAQLAGKPADTARVRLLLAVSGHAAAHVERGTARDSALRFAKEAMTVSTRIGYDSGVYKAYLKEIAVWLNVSDWQRGQNQEASRALENAQAVQAKLVAVVEQKGLPELLGEAYIAMAEIYENAVINYGREVMPLYDSASACFRRSGNAVRESYALYCLGIWYHRAERTKESLPIYHRSITLGEATSAPHLYSAYVMLGRAYGVLGGYALALKYQLKALQLAEAARDTTDEMGAIHLFLGLTYRSLRNHALAREHFEKAYRIERHYTRYHAGEFIAAAINLATEMSRENPEGAIEFLTRLQDEYKTLIATRALEMSYGFLSAYSRKHDYATAQQYCNQIIAATKGSTNLLLPYQRVSAFFVQSGQYDRAEEYLVKAERIAKAEGKSSFLHTIYLDWFKVDSARGNTAQALAKFKLHKAYGDSLLNDTKAKEIALLEIEYETAKKEQSIALLTRDSELGRQQLAQSRFQKNVFLGGLVVAVLILGLLFNQYRIKQKSNLQLARQKQEIECRQKEIESTNALLHKTVLEKEWLLKEVHHRVKNNLQTVVSLLGSQSYMLQNSEAVSAIQDSQNRVHAMSLIHQKLYLTEHRTSINMAGYLHELVDYLRDSFSAGRRIQFSLDIQPIELDVSQAIPIGLILNEAVTNTIKYAFPPAPEEGSRVVVTMDQDAERNVCLTISDNGAGLPPDFDSSGNHFGMGLRLMQGLASEIDGRFKISKNDVGVGIEVTFVASVLLD